MNKGLALIASAGIGAGLMYIFDPDRGRRRRALARDKVIHVVNKTGDALGKTSRDLSNRVTGLVAEAESLFKRDKVSDETLVKRVRSRLGRVVSHPGSIEVMASDGLVTLSGPILASEVDDLLKCVLAVRGVKGMVDNLDVHVDPDGVPGLQGGRPRPGMRWDVLQTNWSPTTRLLAGIAGGALIAYGVKRRGIIGGLSEPLGIAILSRALTNLEMKRLVGIGAGPDAVHIEKTINIAAPVDMVFDLWTHHEKFPQFMSRVREVRPIGEGRYHWVVAGPLGVSVEWDAEITKLVPNQLLEFRSLEGSAIEQRGTIHFQPVSQNETSVDIKLSYTPPAGAVGHLVAMLFGTDPKSEMDEDLMRMKSFIETGKIPHDAAQKAARGGALH
ncbi:MAG TPA: SRPBCC family protein [Blastocatellia bacterium]|nr:SRPBCC family protein [Blastocatellia bacterium]